MRASLQTITLFLFLLLPFSSDAFSVGNSGQDQPTVLENDHVRMVFEPRYAGLASMVDAASGIDHIHQVPDAHALWQISFSDDTGAVDIDNTHCPYQSATVTRTWNGSQRATFRWTGLPFEDIAGGGVVEVEVELPRDSGIASWKIRVENKSRTLGLSYVDFPKLNGFLEARTYDLAGSFGHRETWGSLYRGFTGRLQMRYPDGWRGMSTQVICASQDSSSVYMAAHDPRAWFKEFIIEPGNDYFIRTYAENMGVAGSGYHAPYPAMLGVYRGDWLTGCKIYRQFAVTTPWTSNGKVSEGKVTLRAGRDIGLWLREWDWTKDSVGDHDGMIKQVREAKDYFGVPLGFHWYNWPVADFDTKYPHFFPAKPGVEELARGMVDLGLVVMPYINGRIVDQSNEDFPDLVEFAAKRKNRVYTERYGNGVKQAVMCPFTQFWQDQIVSNVEQVVTGLGVNAVYIDQIAAAPSCLCFDRLHGHPLGGGSWWVDGYRQMLRKVRARARGGRRNVLITSECTAEPYMDGLDEFLVVTQRSKYSIPVLPAVYSGYTIYFGSDEEVIRTLSHEQWVMEMGRDFLWGCQNGWFGFDLFRPENEQKRAYLKTLAQARMAGIKYLAEGELVGLFDDGSRSDYQDIPYVQGSIWKGEDGTLGVIIANYRTQSSTITYSLNPGEYGLRSRTGYHCTTIYPVRGVTTSLLAGIIRINETLEPLEVRILVIKR